MGRIPCCEKDNVKRGQWTPEEDNKLSSYIAQYGTRNWRLIPKNAGLQRCGKSCRLRWTNYLRPDLNHSQFTADEEHAIVKLHSVVGNRWSLIAAQLPGRTDNDVKNHWNTKIKKKLSGMGIDPVTHKPFSHLMAEIATTLAPPQVANLAEAALGCFKDEMFHLLTKKRIDFQLQQPGAAAYLNDNSAADFNSTKQEAKNDIINRIRPWDPEGATSASFGFPASLSGFHCGASSFGNEADGSPWSQCSGSPCPGGDEQGRLLKDDKRERCQGKQIRHGSNIYNSDSVLWDLPSDDLMNPVV
ncbi:hypothetical protein DCAR_0520179 [Daucus carota subsp. sativus]|uniref:Uncharacterized protein n=1 Tax=Daucus carota subsp. sativus TaxID=79200 RepID=A0A164YDJ6_DAUCS|nr:PREDICTED: transcription factor MYB80-like [Daucus carota subsp. sativus]WOH00804.1 hypothetical protein DCAR_0520179 [Daucus carota subsp. sativus]